MDMIHHFFHVSLLYKYVYDLVHVLQVEDRELKDGLVYEENLVQILDRWVKWLKNKQILLVKAFWRNHKVEEAI